MNPLEHLRGRLQGWFYSPEYIFFVANSEDTVVLLQGLTYNDKIKLRRYNLK